MGPLVIPPRKWGDDHPPVIAVIPCYPHEYPMILMTILMTITDPKKNEISEISIIDPIGVSPFRMGFQPKLSNCQMAILIPRVPRLRHYWRPYSKSSWCRLVFWITMLKQRRISYIRIYSQQWSNILCERPGICGLPLNITLAWRELSPTNSMVLICAYLNLGIPQSCINPSPTFKDVQRCSKYDHPHLLDRILDVEYSITMILTMITTIYDKFCIKLKIIAICIIFHGHGKSPCLSSVNHLFLWAMASIAMLVITRGYHN